MSTPAPQGPRFQFQLQDGLALLLTVGICFGALRKFYPSNNDEQFLVFGGLTLFVWVMILAYQAHELGQGLARLLKLFARMALAIPCFALIAIVSEPVFRDRLFAWDILKATWTTVELTLICMPVAAVFGLALAMGRRSRSCWISWPSIAYIEFVRGTPLLVQLAFVYYSLPEVGILLDSSRLLRHSSNPDFYNQLLTWNAFWVGVACLSGNYAAYEAEIHRAALQAVDPGQREAALSLGLSETRAFFLVVLPQALRIAVPPMMNDLTAMLKDCSLLSTISVLELMTFLQGKGKQGPMMKMLALGALIYLVLSLCCTALGRWLERRLMPPGAAPLKVEGPRK